KFEIAYAKESTKHETYLEEKKEAIPKLHYALTELTEGGLIKWDRSIDKNAFNMHPVVRGHAKEINLSDNKTTYKKARDYFSAIPEPKETEKITDISHISVQLFRIHSTIGAELYEETLEFYKKYLHNVLTTRLYNFSYQVEYLKALFKNDELKISSLQEQEWVYRNLSYGLYHIGDKKKALQMIHQAIKINLNTKNWANLSTCLATLINIYNSLNNLFASNKMSQLRYGLCEAFNLNDIKNSLRFLVCTEIMRGNFTMANQFFKENEEYVNNNANSLFWKWINQYYQGNASKKLWDNAYQKARNENDLLDQRYCLTEMAIWKLKQGKIAPANENINKAIELMHIMGEYCPSCYAIKAWILAKLNKTNQAKNQLLLIDEKDQGYYAALVWWKLGETAKSEESAVRAYKNSWSSGPPYSYSSTLKKAKELIEEKNWPIPKLPDFDANLEIPFLKEIQAIIDGIEKK
ncbi:MAG: hypothetical protein AB3N14_21475, partial [Flavobacteriaceae bacterium]